MDCVPPCRECTGLCLAVSPRLAAPVSPSPRGDTARSGYILLTCLHYTTLKDQIATRPFRPKGKKMWCDKDSKWVLPMITKPVRIDPTEPMF
jgi:hypothetical protein